MIVRTIDEIRGTDREVRGETWTSWRLLLKKDGMGFSFHETIIRAGTETRMWYKNHVESVYCVAGKGEIENLEDGKKYTIEPGFLYALNNHDRHVIRVAEDLRLLCVFNPPVTGREVHDKDGAYALVADEEPEVLTQT